MKIAIYIEDKTKTDQAKQLAHALKAPIVETALADFFLLTLTAQRLELRLPAQMQPLYIDFLAKQLRRRIEKNQSRTELILRSIGLKQNYYPRVIDTTAGFGNDAMLMAAAGCKVTMLERSPLIHALLQDALTRAQHLQPALVENLKLHCIDAKEFLAQQIAQQKFVEVVYLDPMFPLRKKSALVKKEMQILQRLVGKDEPDAGALFILAKQCASKRVVVKRALQAPPMNHEKPDIIYKARAYRFDIYLQLK